MAALFTIVALLAGSHHPSPRSGFIAFAETPRHPTSGPEANVLMRAGVVGRSREGRAIRLEQFGDPAWPGRMLVFGCIHGDECAASGVEPLGGGCPDPSADILLIPDLDPDGSAAHSRLNGRGVDLNRNFGSRWRPRGSAGDPEYPGPHPFSEPETRLAARIISAVRPAATIWFHQYRGRRPFVRAWGRSTASARHFAHLARVPFRAMRWPAGTAPRWQNQALHQVSFVVELPQGSLEPHMRPRLSNALLQMGRWVRED